MRTFNTKECNYDSKDNNIDSKSGKKPLRKKIPKAVFIFKCIDIGV